LPHSTAFVVVTVTQLGDAACADAAGDLIKSWIMPARSVSSFIADLWGWRSVHILSGSPAGADVRDILGVLDGGDLRAHRGASPVADPDCDR
jgi:hypothetical protein